MAPNFTLTPTQHTAPSLLRPIVYSYYCNCHLQLQSLFLYSPFVIPRTEATGHRQSTTPLSPPPQRSALRPHNTFFTSMPTKVPRYYTYIIYCYNILRLALTTARPPSHRNRQSTLPTIFSLHPPIPIFSKDCYQTSQPPAHHENSLQRYLLDERLTSPNNKA